MPGACVFGSLNRSTLSCPTFCAHCRKPGPLCPGTPSPGASGFRAEARMAGCPSEKGVMRQGWEVLGVQKRGGGGGGRCASCPAHLRDPCGHSPSGHSVNLGHGPKTLTSEATSSLNTGSDMHRVSQGQGFSTWHGLGVTLIGKPIKPNSAPQATQCWGLGPTLWVCRPQAADLITQQPPFQTLSSRGQGRARHPG